MKLRPEQLDGHLQQPLLPVYLLSGDEPLQMMEAGDAIRAAARAQGYSERQVMDVDARFDWGELSAAGDALSLFAERRLIELRIPSGKPGDAGGKALRAYCEALPPDNLLLVSCPRLDRRQQGSAWFKALEQAGAVLSIWPVERGQLPGWVMRRMSARGLHTTPAAAQLLAEQVEGNLLAAAQEIDKLVLLHGGGRVDVDEVAAAVADSSRYNAFELVEASLAGEAARVARILEGLRREGDDALHVLGALNWELHNMARMAEALAAGTPLAKVLADNRVWDKRKPMVQAGLQRHPARRWLQLLRRAGRVDRVSKGAEPGNPWDELLQLALLVAGQRIV